MKKSAKEAKADRVAEKEVAREVTEMEKVMDQAAKARGWGLVHSKKTKLAGSRPVLKEKLAKVRRSSRVTPTAIISQAAPVLKLLN